jgi:hypothetical protein
MTNDLSAMVSVTFVHAADNLGAVGIPLGFFLNTVLIFHHSWDGAAFLKTGIQNRHDMAVDVIVFLPEFLHLV